MCTPQITIFCKFGTSSFAETKNQIHNSHGCDLSLYQISIFENLLHLKVYNFKLYEIFEAVNHSEFSNMKIWYKLSLNHNYVRYEFDFLFQRKMRLWIFQKLWFGALFGAPTEIDKLWETWIGICCFQMSFDRFSKFKLWQGPN